MIQDIAPHQYQVCYQPTAPGDMDVVLIYRDNKILTEYCDGQLRYPTVARDPNCFSADR